MSSRPYLLAIGGFDPCGGAGILADIKTFEAHGAFGLAAMTANTIQTEDSFIAVETVSTDYLLRQIAALLDRYPIAACKIGLTTSFRQLTDIICALSSSLPNLPIIWDPVLRATAGHENLLSLSDFTPATILPQLALITPNIPEFAALFPNASPQQIARQYPCALLLKGGHADPACPSVEDRLYSANTLIACSVPRAASDKHGTGCVLSSAIAAHLALGAPLPEAVRLAQLYVAHFIASHPSRLGIHTRCAHSKN